MKFLSDIDVDQGSEVLLGSGEYLSWGTAGVTSIEGSTASNRIRFYTSSTLSLTLDSSQNAIFAGDATIGSSGSSSDKTLNILTGGTKSSVKLMEAGTVYGFSTVYDGATNKFHINRHNNSAAGTPVLSLNRDDDNATFAGNVSLADGKELIFGAATDFKIYHNSTSNVNHVSSLLDRQLSINGNIINLTNQANTANYLVLNSTSATFAGHIIPAADATYDLGTTDSKDFRTLYIRNIDLYNQRLFIDASGTLPRFYDHSTVGDGFQFLHLGTEILRLGNGSSTSATFAGDLTVSGGDITLGGTGRIQGVDTVSATTDAANKAYVDAVNVGVTQITAGTNITISPVGGTGNVTINAASGGSSLWSTDTNGITYSGSVGVNIASSTLVDLRVGTGGFRSEGIIYSAGTLTIGGDLSASNGVGTAGQVLTSGGSGNGASFEDNFNSDTTGEPSGSDVMVNIVSLTQAEYDAGTPVSTTLYIIT